MSASTTELFTNEGTLYQYAGEEGDHPYYKPLGDVDAFTISLVKHKKAPGTAGSDKSSVEYIIAVAEDGENVFEQPIGVDLQLSYSAPAASVHWPAIIDEQLETVAFRFAAPASRAGQVTAQMRMQEFVELYNRCTYSLLTGYDEVDPQDEWYQYLGGATTREVRNEDATEAVFEFDAAQLTKASTGSGNICAAESLQFNRILVVKKGNEEASLEMQALPQTERGFDRAAMEKLVVRGVDDTSTGTLLENGDATMLLFGGRKAAVQQLDLTRGTVVQEYKPADLPLQSVAYANHTAASSGSVYTCLGRNVAFNIDVRMDPRNCVIMEDGKQPTDYALLSLRKDFTCHATSQNGYLVIGDGCGNIRLYTGPPGARKPDGGYFPKAAKTLLDTKMPIVDIDVTADGQYIVATSTSFLLFIETKYVDSNGKESTGFQTRMGVQKPQPIILQPSPEQTLRMGGASMVRFQSAKFDRFPGTKELCVTASCGDYLLTWSLRAIESSQQSGRAVVNSAVAVGQTVLSTSANRASHVGFLTGNGVGVVPVHEAKMMSRAWTWGAK
ncbi:conserved hypothetical protein [Leishmania braziliensis MHOM/BR/75/M2904]|uniref:Vacuolar import/degradation Vid27 C-terminal domain-containing protein n=2 Tax=Leishmania braziliensis TaxID=5660 RepID=A4H914_LEIBR|nr:conserved hypothetical protein [Leishmania braziliensis MHOM/BR/75/M2904]KAI5687242.1 VID27 cytoplasmic protein [Leishmania braziliensis]CAJ2470054.1 unnamed protein product [Leishmania braziliensis]CAJ2470558.1 unnamed protein product [Leishmania braziliensis]CAM37883.1 conserved hypothetical protein [Leishmania braziliensis MHOM/BR/75/M2904]SYZ64551.1 VID27_cytoplasmic_protein [Leishmania braziliensis MHOM/BR/75/M2904]